MAEARVEGSSGRGAGFTFVAASNSCQSLAIFVTQKPRAVAHHLQTAFEIRNLELDGTVASILLLPQLGTSKPKEIIVCGKQT